MKKRSEGKFFEDMGFEDLTPVGKYGATRYQVDICKKWISLYFEPRKRLYLRSSSYGYKHIVENWEGFYICSDAFTQAALELGYEAETKCLHSGGEGRDSFFKGVVNKKWKSREHDRLMSRSVPIPHQGRYRRRYEQALKDEGTLV